MRKWILRQIAQRYAKTKIKRMFRKVAWGKKQVAILTHRCTHRKQAIYTLACHLVTECNYNPLSSQNIELVEYAKALVKKGYKIGWDQNQKRNKYKH